MSNSNTFSDNPSDAVSEVVLTEDYIRTVLTQHEQFRVENALLRGALEQLGAAEMLLFIEEVHILAVENSPAVQAFIARIGETTDVPKLQGAPISDEEFSEQMADANAYDPRHGPRYRTDPDAVPAGGFKNPAEAVEVLAQIGRSSR